MSFLKEEKILLCNTFYKNTNIFNFLFIALILKYSCLFVSKKYLSEFLLFLFRWQYEPENHRNIGSPVGRERQPTAAASAI